MLKGYVHYILFLLLFIFVRGVAIGEQNSSPDKLVDKDEARLFEYYITKTNYYLQHNLDSAILYSDSAIKVSEVLDDSTIKSKAYRKKGQVLLYMGKNKDARSVLGLALDYSRQENDTSYISGLNYLMGISYYNAGDFTNALSCYQLALDQAVRANDRYRQSLCNTAIGIIYSKKGDQNTAIRFFLNAAKLADDTDLDQRASIYNNIGNIYLSQKQYDKALIYFDKALRVVDTIGDLYIKTKVLLGVSSANEGLGNDDQALNAVNKALKIAQRLDNQVLLSRVYSHLADYYEGHDSLSAATKYLNLAMDIYSKGSNKEGLVETYQKLSNIFLKQYFAEKNENRLDHSIQYALDAYENAEKMELLGLMHKAALTLRNAYKAKGDLEKALHYAELYSELSDSLFNRDKLATINELEARYNDRKNKQVIEKLQLEKEAESKSLQLQKERVYYLLIGFILVLFFLGIILNSLIKNRKMRIELDSKRANLEMSQRELDELNNKLNTYYLESVRNSIEIVAKNKTISEQLEVIEEKNRQFNSAIENIEDVYFRTDKRFNYTFVSPSVKKYLGINDLNKIIGKPLTEYWLISKKEAISLIREIKKTTYLRNLAIKYKTTEGELRYATVSASVIVKDGYFNGIEGIVRDVTESYINTKRIKDLHLQKEILLNNLPSLVFFKDLNLRYIEVNVNFAKRLGCSIEEIIGKTDFDLIDEELAAKYERVDEDIIKTKVPKYDVVESQECKDGKLNWYSTTKVPFLDSSSNVKGIIGVVRDITRRVEYEKSLLKSKERIEEAHKKMLDNINYARTIQSALMTSEERIKECLTDFFVLYQPKDRVSGDFYYIKRIRDYLVFAAADCTGHGVSGAFLTMLGITFLHDISNIEEVNSAGKVLDALRDKVKNTFTSFGSNNHNGLDIAYCALNLQTYVLQYAGAYNPLLIVRNGKLIEYKATRNPIGYYPKEVPFENHNIQLEPGDVIYLFSDGYIDQIGGLKKKKLKSKRFKELLLDISSQPLALQKELLLNFLNDWKGDEEQTDDIVVMGLRV